MEVTSTHYSKNWLRERIFDFRVTNVAVVKFFMQRFQLIKAKGRMDLKTFFVIRNHIMDLGNHHQWILKPLGQSWMRNFLVEGSGLHQLN